jgi:hypothetical protein
MEAVLTGLIGVAGAVLGSFTTYLFQNRAAKRSQAFERDERRRQEQLYAIADFAAAVTELKRGLVTLRFRFQQEPGGEEYRAAYVESDRLGAAMESARFRVQLVCGDPELVNLADVAVEAAAALTSPPSRKEMRAAEDQFEAAVKAFIATAASRLPASSARPVQQPDE